MYSKRLKTPPLTKTTKLLCFDLETNGLHGDAFAIGAVVLDAHGTVHEEFTGRTKIIGQVDPWVEANVLSSIKDMIITHTSYKALREDFWKWYLKAEQNSDYVLVSNGYPVEYRFLLQCQEENIEERYWQHPFPILDLSSLLIMIGAKNNIQSEVIKTGSYLRHHPLHDSKVTALAAFEAFKLARLI